MVRLRSLQLDSVNVRVVSLLLLASSPASPGGVQLSVVGGLRESTSPAACAQIRVAVLRSTPGLSVGAGGVYLIVLRGELRVKGLHLEPLDLGSKPSETPKRTERVPNKKHLYVRRILRVLPPKTARTPRKRDGRR